MYSIRLREKHVLMLYARCAKAEKEKSIETVLVSNLNIRFLGSFSFSFKMPANTSSSRRESNKKKDEDYNSMWRVMIVLNNQNYKIFSLILVLLGALWLMFLMNVSRGDYNLQLLEKLSFCSKTTDEKQPQKNEEKFFDLFENQLARYKMLTRVYAIYFRQPETLIDAAISNDRLWRNVKYIFDIDSPQLYLTVSNDLSKSSNDHEKPAETNDKYINDNSNSKSNHELVNNSRNINEEALPYSNSDIQKRNNIREKRKPFYDVASTDIKKLEILFEHLTGYTVNMYLDKKTASFKLTGNLNLWKYFVDESFNNDLFSLQKNTTLESNFDNENITFSMPDSYPARTSGDNKYLLYDKLIDGQKFIKISQESKITVTTQMSVDRMHTFVQSYKYWNGPISLAIFLNGPMEYFLLRSYLLFMKRCYPHQFERTRFNIATPIDDPIPRDVFIQTKDFNEVICSAKNNVINKILKKQLIKSNKWLKIKWYPQNMMRNLARVNVITDYHITLDVDIIPCPKMNEKVNKFLSTSYVYTNALVIPTYEVSRKVQFPAIKSELVMLTKKGMAQPFHRDVYLPNQNATNFSKWEKVHDSFDDVHVIHEVRNFPIHYEPFFIELNSSPMYDENFVGYGFTRSSHAYEMFLRNGHFLILSPIYTVQVGIQKVKEWSQARQQQNEYNRLRFDIFVKNLTSQFYNLPNVTVVPEFNNFPIETFELKNKN